MSELVITMEEMCSELQCSEVKLRLLIARGDIPAVQPGKAYVVPRQAFYDAVNELAKAEAAKRRAPTSPPPPADAAPAPRKGRRGPRPSAEGWAWLQPPPSTMK